MTDTTQAVGVTKDQIRSIFMAHGFTIKDGQTDLKDYVYKAADALIRAALAAQAVPAGYKLLKDTTHAERSWSEDASHENGHYSNTCCECGRVFTGHKRRVVCKVCTSPAPAEAKEEPTYCRYCQGSGESTYVVGRGPDAHDEPCNCDKCGGTGLFQAGRTVDVGQIEYEGYTVSFIHAKMKAYQYVLDTAWEALKKAGVKPDGNTSIAMGIERLATPQPQAEQPVAYLARDPGGYLVVVADDSPDRPSLKPFPVYTDAAPALTEEQERDKARLDYLQSAGATIELVGPTLKFRIGGRIEAVSSDLREAIDKARALRSTQGGV